MMTAPSSGAVIISPQAAINLPSQGSACRTRNSISPALSRTPPTLASSIVSTWLDDAQADGVRSIGHRPPLRQTLPYGQVGGPVTGAPVLPAESPNGLQDLGHLARASLRVRVRDLLYLLVLSADPRDL